MLPRPTRHCSEALAQVGVSLLPYHSDGRIDSTPIEIRIPSSRDWSRSVHPIPDLAQLMIISLGTFGEAYSNEVYFACLEYVPVVLALAILAIKPLYKQIKTTPREETYKA